jgi:putative membrane protein
MLLYYFINTGILFIALLHIWFCMLEMFLWQKPLGLKTFKLEPDFAARSAPLAANQGLYNLFLSAGLCWGFFTRDPAQGFSLKVFFLLCVLIAGIYGSATVNRRIFWIQGVPAAIVLLLIFLPILVA